MVRVYIKNTPKNLNMRIIPWDTIISDSLKIFTIEAYKNTYARTKRCLEGGGTPVYIFSLAHHIPGSPASLCYSGYENCLGQDYAERGKFRLCSKISKTWSNIKFKAVAARDLFSRILSKLAWQDLGHSLCPWSTGLATARNQSSSTIGTIGMSAAVLARHYLLTELQIQWLWEDGANQLDQLTNASWEPWAISLILPIKNKGRRGRECPWV